MNAGIGKAEVGGERQRVSQHESEKAWPYIVKELGLVQDSYGEWTLPGRELTAESLAKILR